MHPLLLVLACQAPEPPTSELLYSEPASPDGADAAQDSGAGGGDSGAGDGGADSGADSGAGDSGAGPASGEGIFAEGCPEAGYALAREIGVDAGLPGKVAVGRRGDLLLASEAAAFVITAPGTNSTYYYYGGVLADVVALEGCAPESEDKLDEVGLVLGELNLADFNQSVLRAFRGDRAEILSDGADGGPAIVRITGADDTHWLVEYELISAAVSEGGRPFSSGYGLSWQVDYILEPDSGVLRVEQTWTNTGEVERTLIAGTLLSFGETMDVYTYPSGEISVGGLTLNYGIPWLVATDGEDALAYAVEAGNLAYTRISGIDVAVDLLQALSAPIQLAPGESDTRAFFLSAGAGDGASATAPLAEVNPEPVPSLPYTLAEASGVAVDAAGDPVPGARIVIYADGGAGWGALDEVVAGEDGAFIAPLPDFAEPWSYRLQATADGRDPSEEVDALPGEAGLTLTLSEPGALSYDIIDGMGAPSPARLYLERDDGEVFHRWLAGEGEAPLPPGEYSFTATRGYEYAPVYGALTVPAGGAAALALTMEAVVDTTGWMSVDTHVHSSDSSDSRTGQAEVLQHAAAHGLEIVVHTEHENIVDRSGAAAEGGVDAFVSSVIGEEVTATLPEHMTMFPAVPDGSIRGGIVDWYGMDIAEIYAAMRERSEGGVSLLNHPSYLGIIDWDDESASPGLDDPTLLGLAPDAAIWDWDFDGLEVVNGHSSPFDDGNGRFDRWMSMLNAGHALVAAGASDDHSGDQVGFPRSYFAAGTDDPAALDEGELVDAYQSGAVLVSAGGFMRVSVDGAGLGEQVTAAGGEVALDLHVEAIPEIDVTHVSVFVNCDEVLTLAADDPDGVVKLSGVWSLPIEGDAHVTAAAFGQNRLPAGLPQYDAERVPRAMSNAIFVDGDGDGVFSAPGGRTCDYRLTSPE
jgi:hypothetical protein